jgi:hypothetical protein
MRVPADLRQARDGQAQDGLASRKSTLGSYPHSRQRLGRLRDASAMLNPPTTWGAGCIGKRTSAMSSTRSLCCAHSALISAARGLCSISGRCPMSCRTNGWSGASSSLFAIAWTASVEQDVRFRIARLRGTASARPMTDCTTSPRRHGAADRATGLLPGSVVMPSPPLCRDGGACPMRRPTPKGMAEEDGDE